MNKQQKQQKMEGKKFKVKNIITALENIQRKVEQNPSTKFKFIPEAPAVKNGKATTLRKSGKELIYFSKAGCHIINTQTGFRTHSQNLPKNIIWGGTPRYKITGVFLSKSENEALIFTQDSFMTDYPYFWLYSIEKNSAEFFKFKDSSVRLIQNHGFHKEIYFTMINGCSLGEVIFDPDQPNFKPKKTRMYPGLGLFKMNLVSKRVELIMKLSEDEINVEEIGFQLVLDLKFHKKPIIWFFEHRLGNRNLILKGICVVEKKINFVKNVEYFKTVDPDDFQSGCDMMDYMSFCVCLEQNFQIFDLIFFESSYLYFDKLKRKTSLFSIMENQDEIKNLRIGGIYNKTHSYELEKKISKLPKPEDFSLIQAENLIFLVTKYEHNVQIVSHLLSPLTHLKSVEDFSPVQLTYHLAISGVVYCLTMMKILKQDKVINVLSNDIFCWHRWIDDNILHHHYFSGDYGYFVTHRSKLDTNDHLVSSDRLVDCTSEVVREIENFASEVYEGNLEVRGDPFFSQPQRKLALFKLNGNFVVYEINEKKLKFRTVYKPDHARSDPKIYEFKDNGEEFYLSIMMQSQVNEGYQERRLYRFSKPEKSDPLLLKEEILLDFEDYVEEGIDILQFFFFRDNEKNNKLTIFYIARESLLDDPLIYCFNPRNKELDAVAHYGRYFLSPLSHDYLQGEDFTIFPNGELKLYEIDGEKDLKKFAVIHLKQKKIWYFEPMEKLVYHKSNFVLEEEEIVCEIDWAGYKNENFYIWVTFKNHQKLAYIEYDTRRMKQRVLRWVETGFLKNEFRQRMYSYEEYAFQPASTSAFYCFLRERFIETNFDKKFSELKKKITIEKNINPEELVDDSHPLYLKLLKKFGMVFTLMNVDSNYVVKNLKILEELILVGCYTSIKKYAFYILGPLAKQRGVEFDKSIDDFCGKFPDPVRVKLMIAEIFQT